MTNTRLLKYADLEKLISQPRLDRFLIASGNSKAKAQKLYTGNLRISQAFYPVLNLFEIILRNKIHNRLSAFFTNPDWIITEKTGFMQDITLQRSRYYMKNQVLKAERKMRRRGSTITTGKVIAEQTLGFWTILFEPNHYRLVGGSIINCFPNKPAAINRSSINVKLENIRDFRNRIYHNEPICFNGNNIDFNKAENIKNNISNLASWISNDAKKYIDRFDNIDNKIAIARRI